MAQHSLTKLDSNKDVLRVLLVEDSEIDRDLIRQLLTKMWPRRNDLQIDFATAGYEALAMIRANSYALLLLDWCLPDMDGNRLLAALQRDGFHLPVVVLTGLELAELPRNIEEYGIVYLHKDNLNVTTLHQSIATALSNVLRADIGSSARPSTLASRF